MDQIRQHLVAALRGGQAYDTFDGIVAEFKPGEYDIVPPGARHSAWQILEHMKISLRDILDFCQNEDGSYEELDWPAEYWPESQSPVPGGWEQTIEAYHADLREFVGLIRDESRDLFTPFSWGQGQTLFREALLVADHAAYHLGQLVELHRWIVATP
ncbi:MAG TPA: DinB family protein [Fimbriimonadaceae bacterium]|nr:DinB family protein [Fimbriimonadaceae bacterium]